METTYPKAPVLDRILARVIDTIAMLIVMAIFGIPAVILWLLSFLIITIPIAVVLTAIALLITLLYRLLMDGLFDGRSIGKKVMGLRVINIEKDIPCSYTDSILRNVIFVLPVLAGILSLVELLLVIVDEKGIRIGDRIAKTQVIKG